MVRCKTCGIDIPLDVAHLNRASRDIALLICDNGHVNRYTWEQYDEFIHEERRFSDPEENHLKEFITNLLKRDVADEDLKIEAIFEFERTAAAGRIDQIGRKRLGEMISDLIKKTKKDYNKEKTGPISEYRCPSCAAVFLRERRDEDGKIQFYYCPAENRKFSPLEIKEGKVFGKKKFLGRYIDYQRKRRESKGVPDHALTSIYNHWEQLKKKEWAMGLTPAEQNELYVYDGLLHDQLLLKRNKWQGVKYQYRKNKWDLDFERRHTGMSSREYKIKLDRLRGELEKTKAEYRDKKYKLREERRIPHPPKLGKFSDFPKFVSDRWGKRVMSVLLLLFFLGLGALLSAFFGSIYFFVGFLSWGFMYIFPHPDDFNVPKEYLDKVKKNQYGMFLTPFIYGGRTLGHAHVGFGMLRSLLKITAGGAFIFGIMNNANIPFANLILIVVTMIVHGSLKTTFEREKPYEFFESLIRFMALGMIIIPFIIFRTIFESWLLAFMAFAFFFVPPIPAREEDAPSTYGFLDLGLRVFFFLLMGFVLLSSGVLGTNLGLSGMDWQLSGAIKYTFIYFWAMSLIAGVFAPPEHRPSMGFVMLGLMTVLYALTPTGEASMGSALLGQWYPTVKTTVESIARPISDMFGQLSMTFGNTLFLIANPVGYANQIMNGSYSTDSTTGLAGALGLEFQEFRSPAQIFPHSPLILTMKFQNKGSSEAKLVDAYISMDPLGAPKVAATSPKGITEAPGAVLHEIESGVSGASEVRLKLTELGFKERNTEPQLLIVGERGYIVPQIDSVSKLETRQVFFQADDGIPCGTITRYNLREKTIPIIGTIEYNYEVDSALKIEFMSNNEWNRLVEDGRMEIQRKQSSYISNSPARLNLDTIEQPIKEGTPFFLNINLANAKAGKEVKISRQSITVTLPAGLADYYSGCSQEPKAKPVENNKYKMEWEGTNFPQNGIIICYFKGFNFGTSKKPGETFLVTGHASFKFAESQKATLKVDFGGGCCEPDDCQNGMSCVWIDPDTKGKMAGRCGSDCIETLKPYQKGSEKYCEMKSGVGCGLCEWGMGGCTNSNQCNPSIKDATVSNTNPVDCISINGISGIKVCCQEGNDEHCKQKFNLWRMSL